MRHEFLRKGFLAEVRFFFFAASFFDGDFVLHTIVLWRACFEKFTTGAGYDSLSSSATSILHHELKPFEAQAHGG